MCWTTLCWLATRRWSLLFKFWAGQFPLVCLKVVSQKLLALLYSARWSMIFFIVLMYGQEQNITSRRTNKLSAIPLLVTSGLYGCRKPSWPTWRTGKPVLLEEREISVQLPKAKCSCHTRPMKASRSLSIPTWSNQIPPFCMVWICVYRKVHARCDWGLLWVPKDPERKIR